MCKKEGTKQMEGLLEIVGLGDDDNEQFWDRYNFEELQLESSRFELQASNEVQTNGTENRLVFVNLREQAAG